MRTHARPAMTHPDAARAVNGHLVPMGERLFVCRSPLSTSLPIPLGIRAPAGVDLLTWAFAGLGDAGLGDAGLGDEAPAPRVLLVLSARDAEAEAHLRGGGGLVVETHFHDLAVTVPSPSEAPAFSAEDRDALCRAVLAAVRPDTFAALSTLFPQLSAAMAELPILPGAPDLTIATDADPACTLTGHAVPNYLMLISASGSVSCARVASASLSFGALATCALVLEPAWGVADGRAPVKALLLGDDHATPVTVVAGAA